MAFSISSELGIDGDYFNERLSSFKVPSGRGDIIYKDNLRTIGFLPDEIPIGMRFKIRRNIFSVYITPL